MCVCVNGVGGVVRDLNQRDQVARQKSQSGERDNPLLFIYPSHVQGTSQEAFSLNIE